MKKNAFMYSLSYCYYNFLLSDLLTVKKKEKKQKFNFILLHQEELEKFNRNCPIFIVYPGQLFQLLSSREES